MLRHHMVTDLATRGELMEPWCESFVAVPRHAFIPDLVWRHDRSIAGDHDLIPFRRGDDPNEWLALTYRNEAVVTQIDDGHPTGENLAGYEVTSSASMPAVVAQMLAALDAQPGMSVLEIGTGTGYNAALLAHRLGADQVTTIDIDQAVAERARTALRVAGYDAVTVITGDGAAGYRPRAPYDRMVSTAAVRTVPYPWVAHTRPGGRIVTPWGTAYYNGGLLALTVTDDGRATGGIIGEASFMHLRAQRIPRFRTKAIVTDEASAAVSTTELHPYDVAGDRHAATAIGLRVPRCEAVYAPAGPDSADDSVDPDSSPGSGPPGTGTLWLVDQWSMAWASLQLTEHGAPYTVHQAGERALWDEVETAYWWWVNAGRPATGDWHFTIGPDGQRIHLS